MTATPERANPAARDTTTNRSSKNGTTMKKTITLAAITAAAIGISACAVDPTSMVPEEVNVVRDVAEAVDAVNNVTSNDDDYAPGKVTPRPNPTTAPRPVAPTTTPRPAAQAPPECQIYFDGKGGPTVSPNMPTEWGEWCGVIHQFVNGIIDGSGDPVALCDEAMTYNTGEDFIYALQTKGGFTYSEAVGVLDVSYTACGIAYPQ